MFKHSIFAGLSMLTIVVGSSSVLANPSSSVQPELKQVIQEYAQAKPSPQREKKRKDLFEQLNLSEQQKQQVSTIRQKYRTEMEQTSSRLRTAQQELQKLMASDASRNSLRAKHAQVGDLRQEMDKLRFESMLDIRDVLTTAQRKELDQMMQQRRTRTPGRMDERPQTPQNPQAPQPL